MPLAPGLFSTIKFCPSFCCSLSAISRAIVSGVAPAPNGTIMRTVFAGHSCALTGRAAQSMNSIKATTRFIDPPGQDFARCFQSCSICPPPVAQVKRSVVFTDYAAGGGNDGPCDPDPRTGRVHWHACHHDAARQARAADRALWRGAVQDRLFG